MDLTTLHLLSASDAARFIRERIITSEQLVEACLTRIRDVDPQVQAWAFLDPDHARAQARAADVLRLSGQPIGPLHGVPVAIKDIFDTADMPTEYGSPIYAGRTPSRDATVVSSLRAAGAVILGRPAIRTTLSILPAVRRADRPPLLAPTWCRSRSVAKPTVQRFARQPIAVSSVSSRRTD